MKINPKNGKILCVADIHLGIHQDSHGWHKIALDLADWIASVMEQRKLDTIFLAGDVFHNRHEIGVDTIFTAKKFFDKLAAYNIYMIPGNHDCYLASKSEINSTEILENKNITVFSEPTVVQCSDKKVAFCPWMTSVSQLDKSDLIVGHFEIVNFRMNHAKICDHGDDPEVLFQGAPRVITGHFHTRDHRTYQDGKYILYLGSPYEMDFGDREQQKGVTIIDVDNDFETEFVENTVTPKHQRLKVSEIVKLFKTAAQARSMVEGNIISLYVDVKVDALTVDTLAAKIIQYGPLQMRTEFNVLEEAAQLTPAETERLSIDVETAFAEFVEIVDTKASKKAVLDKCLELYRTCMKEDEE